VPPPDAKQALIDVLGPQIGEGTDMTDGLPALVEFVRAFGSPTFTCAMTPLPPTPPAEFPGSDGLMRAWENWSETFESIRVEPQELLDGESAVVIMGEQIAVTRHGGVEIRQPSAITFLFRGGQIERIEFHLDREAALRSGGL
jgi:ketosteroid isomerase-like protein